jgi:hypothetical protein
MNKQQTFNKVVRHLRRQGRATDSKGTCMYRTPNGRSCAVGCLIPDELYHESMEGKAVGTTSSPLSGFMASKITALVELLEIDVVLARDLQTVHDHDTLDLEFGFECVALRHGLKVPDVV